MSIKSFFKAIGTSIALFAVTACGDVGKPSEVSGSDVNGERIMSDSKCKVLVVYFSRSGRTRQVAHWIRETAGADLLEIKTVTPYPAGYSEVVKQARKEIDANFRPDLSTKLDNIAQYDVIFVGTPNWWSTMAPPVASFLTSYDFSGKQIIPFITHGGGGEARCASDMKPLCPSAHFLKPLAIRDGRVPEAKDEIINWAKASLEQK